MHGASGCRLATSFHNSTSSSLPLRGGGGGSSGLFLPPFCEAVVAFEAGCEKRKAMRESTLHHHLLWSPHWTGRWIPTTKILLVWKPHLLAKKQKNEE